MDPAELSPERKLGAVGWVCIAGFVAAWDLLTPDSLSAAFGRACSTPVGKVLVPAVWGITTAHLFGKLPRRADPFYFALDRVKRS